MDCSKWIPDSWAADTRLWFYTAQRPLTEIVQDCVLEGGSRFFKDWLAHGQPLRAEWILPQPQLIVLGVFPGVNATGCSLDKAAGFVGKLENDLALDLRNRKRLVLVRAFDIFVGEAEHIHAEQDKGLGWLNIYATTAHEFRANPILKHDTPWIQRMLGAAFLP